MKRQNALAMLVLLASGVTAGGCASDGRIPQGEFLIEGEVTGVADGLTLRLVSNDGETIRTLQRDTLRGGRFRFRDTISGPAARRLEITSDDPGVPADRLTVWVASGKRTSVEGGDLLVPLWRVRSRIAEQRATNAFQELCPTERRRQMELRAEEHTLLRAGNLWSLDWTKIDSLRALSQPLDSLIQLAELHYMRQAPVTDEWLDRYRYYSSFLLMEPRFGHTELIRSLYARMSEADRATDAGREITDYLNLPEAVEAGDPMADGDLYDLEGRVRHLSEFRGRYLLLDFWSQGCGPCIASLPELETIIERYAGRLEVVSISQDSEKRWKAYVAGKGLKGHQWNELRSGRTGLAAAYRVTGIPFYVVIDPDGKVLQIWKGYGKGILEAKMKELIKP